MKLFGITGGIGMGKSTSASFLARQRLPVVDTDDLAREIVEPGQPALAEITSAFGTSVLNEAGKLRRPALAALVFADPARLKQLEEILHPRIRRLWQDQVQSWRNDGVRCGVVVIPLLFETGAESLFDEIVCVACSRPTQFDRLHKRGLSEEQIKQRNAAQWDVQRKMDGSRYVIWTEGTLDIHARQVDRLFSAYLPARR